MASRDVVYKVCDKGKREHPATKTRNFLWFGVRYEIDLCDEHDAQLKSALDEWIECANPLTRSLATQQLVSSPFRQPAPAQIGPNVTGPEKDWVFTNHALERCEQRRIDPEDARRVAQWPQWTSPSPARGPEYEEHMSDDLLVVVMPKERRIITVAPRHRERLLVAGT